MKDRDVLLNWLRRCLWTSGVLTIVALLSGGIWGLLAAANDVRGAAGAQGVFLVAVVFWVLDVMGIVLLTALLQFVEPESPRNPVEANDE